MRAGFFRWDITPPLGAELLGGLTKAYARGLHDPLWVRAAVFGEGDSRVGLVGVDTVAVDARMVAAARERARTLCGIRPERILVAASHTHQGGPSTGPAATGGPDDVCSSPDPAYVERMAQAIASALAVADARAKPAWLAVGAGQEATVSFNRRFRMRQGLEATHPGKGNPDIIAPAGPIDPEVGVLSAWDEEGGGLLGCVVNFACHATTLGGQDWSADWVYYLDRTVRAVAGQEAVIVFLNGAAGDVTQVDNLSRAEADFGERSARIVGQCVGAEVLKVLARARRAPDGDRCWPLQVRQRTLRLGVRRPSAARLEAARALLQAQPDGPWTIERWYARETVLMEQRFCAEPTATFEVQLLQLGCLALVANPAEYFCQLGLDIKAASPFPYTFVVSMANGDIGYVPTARAMGPEGGGYEQRLCRYSFLQVGAGEAIRDVCLDLLREAWAAVPAPAPAWEPVPVGRPWDAGWARGGE